MHAVAILHRSAISAVHARTGSPQCCQGSPELIYILYCIRHIYCCTRIHRTGVNFSFLNKVCIIARDKRSSLTKPGMLLTSHVHHPQQHPCSDLLLRMQHSFNCTVRKNINVPFCNTLTAKTGPRTEKYSGLYRLPVSSPPTAGYVIKPIRDSRMYAAC